MSSLIEEELRAARVPGAAIAIVSGDDVFAGAYGVSERDTSTPMTAATLVHVGSLTKLFTALAVTAALQQRKVPADRASERVHERPVATSGRSDIRAAAVADLRDPRSSGRCRNRRRGGAREECSRAHRRGLHAARRHRLFLLQLRLLAGGRGARIDEQAAVRRRPAIFRIDAARHEPVDDAPCRRDEAAACHGLSTRGPGARRDAARQRHPHLARGLSVDQRDRHVARAVRADVERAV